MITNAGLNIVANALITTNSPEILYVAVGSGLCHLTSALTAGTIYSSLTTSALAVAVTTGQSLTIVSGSQTQIVTASAPAAQNATSISVNAFTANFNYPGDTTVGTSVTFTPTVSDTQLQTEVFRKAITSSQLVSSPSGEAMSVMYLSPTDAAGDYIAEIGWFSGAATSSPNTGTMIARVAYQNIRPSDQSSSLNIQRLDIF